MGKSRKKKKKKKFSVHAGRYLFVTCTRNNVQWIRGGEVGTVSCNPRSYGVPFSHLFTELQISAIDLQISPNEL